MIHSSQDKSVFYNIKLQVTNKHSHNVQQIKRKQKSQRRRDYRPDTVPLTQPVLACTSVNKEYVFQ